MQLVNINQVRGNKNNPRIIKDDKYKQLVKSIKFFPEMLWKRCLVVESNEKGFTVLGGNQRLRAINEVFKTPRQDLLSEISGVPNEKTILAFYDSKQIPVELCDDWTIEQKREFIVRDNVDFGEWDINLLSTEYDLDELEDWGIKMIDYSLGIDANNMSENDIDTNEEFDPIGTASNLLRIVFLFDTEEEGHGFMIKRLPDMKIKKTSGGPGKIWQVNLSQEYGKK